MNEPVKLLTCPFCTGEAHIKNLLLPVADYSTSSDVKWETLYHVECSHCRASTGKYSVEKDATTTWNTRATDINVTTTQPNEPLSIEQLKQMDGVPVWIWSKGFQGYAIIYKTIGDTAYYVQSNGKVRFRHANGYGKTWIAYAHKPEQEDSK